MCVCCPMLGPPRYGVIYMIRFFLYEKKEKLAKILVLRFSVSPTALYAITAGLFIPGSRPYAQYSSQNNKQFSLRTRYNMTTNDSVMLALFELFNVIYYEGVVDVIPDVLDGTFYGEKTNQYLAYAKTSHREERSANSYGVLRVRRKFLFQSLYSIARNDFILSPKYAQTLRQYSWTRSENTYSSNDGYDTPLIHHRERLLADQRQMVLQTFHFAVTSSYNDIFEISLDTVFQFTEFSNDPLLFTLKGLHQISVIHEKYTHQVNRRALNEHLNYMNQMTCAALDNAPFAEMIASAIEYWVETNPELAKTNMVYMDCPYIHHYDPPIDHAYEDLEEGRFELCTSCNASEIEQRGLNKMHASFRQRINEAYREHRRLEIERTFCPDNEIPLVSQGASWVNRRRMEMRDVIPELVSDTESEYELEEGEINSDYEEIARSTCSCVESDCSKLHVCGQFCQQFCEFDVIHECSSACEDYCPFDSLEDMSDYDPDSLFLDPQYDHHLECECSFCVGPPPSINSSFFDSDEEVQLQSQVGIFGHSLDLGLGETKDNFDSLIMEIMTILPKFSESADNLTKITERANKIIDKYDAPGLKEEMKSFLGDIKNNTNFKTIAGELYSTSAIIYLLSSIVNCVFMRDKQSLYYLSIGVIAGFCFAREKIGEILIFMTKSISLNTIVPQSLMSFDLVLTGATAILAGFVVGTSSVRSLPKEIVMMLVQFPRVKQTIKDIFFFFYDLVRMVLKYFNLGAWMGSLGHIKYGSEAITNMVDEIEKIQEEAARSKFHLNEKNFVRIHSLSKALRALQIDLPRDSKTSGLHSAIIDFLHKLDQIKIQFGNSQFGFSGVRNEPWNILMIGGPGTLKSELKEYFAESIISFIADDELVLRRKDDRTAGMYNCTPEVSYHDCYQPDTILTVMDDLFQQVDVAGMQPNEKFLFMRMGNMNPFALECAQIHNKGNTFFSSDCIIATSNAMRISSEAIVDIRAVIRRFHLSIIVHPKPQYRSKETMTSHPYEQKFDVSTFPYGHLGETRVDPEMFMFSQFNVITQQFTGKVFTYDEIVIHSLKEIERRKIWMKQRSKELEDMAEKYIAIRKFYTIRDDLGMIDIEETLKNIEVMKDPSDIIPDLERHAEIDEKYDLLSQALDFSQFNFEKFVDMEETDFVVDLDMEVINMTQYIYDNMDVDQGVRLDDLYARHKNEVGCDFTFKYVIYAYIMMYGSPFLQALNVPQRSLLPFFRAHVEHATFAPSIKTRWKKSAFEYYKDKITSISLPETPSWMIQGIEFIKENYIWYTLIFTAFVAIMKLNPWGIFDIPPPVPEFVPFDLYPDQQSYSGRTKSKNTTASDMKQRLSAKLSKQIAGGHDPSGCELMDSIIKKNTWQFGILQKDHSVFPLGYVTFVLGRIALMPNHFLTVLGQDYLDNKLQGNSYLAITRYDPKGDRTHQLFFTLDELLKKDRYFQNDMMSKQDLVLVEFPKKIPIHSSIVDNFMKDSDAGILMDQPFRVVVNGIRMKDIYSGRARLRNQVITEDTSILVGFEYTATSKMGDCGALFSIMNPSSQIRKIAGVHVAGNTLKAVGYSSFVSQEMLRSTLEMFGEVIVKDPETDIQLQSTDISDGQFLNVCLVDKPCPAALVSEIKRSAIYNKFYISKEAPGKLRTFVDDRGLQIDPYLKAVSKYGKIEKPLPIRLLRHATNLVFDSMMKCSTIIVDKRILTIEEAVKGIENDSDFGSIPRNTSPGYPYNVEVHPGYNKKHFWLGNDLNYDLSKAPGWQIMKQKVFDDLEKAKNNILVETIYTDNMKDETRPYEKVLIGKTRLFSGAPLPYTIKVRMYFGSFCLWIYKNRIDNHCAVGVNPYSSEWDKMAMHFREFCSSPDDLGCGAGDYSGFDSSQSAEVLELVLLIIQKWYGDCAENQRVRAILWEDVMHSIHIRENIKYEWTNSLPSGNPMTLIINYMYNYICFMYSWIRVTSELPEIHTRFHDFVYVIFQGDDQAFSVHPLVREVFNEQTLVEVLAELGMTYTNENKQKSLVKLRRFDEISFMKRTFRLDPLDHKFVGPLEIDSIFECLNWTKKKDYFGISRQNVDLAVRELALHGPEVFEQYIHDLSSVSFDYLSHWPCTTSYSVARAQVRELILFF